MKQLLWREQCMERERKRAEQQQQQQQQQQLQQQSQQQQHISQLQHHLQMSSSAGGGSGGYSVRQQPPLRAESAPAVNIPGVGARIKEIPTEVLQVSTSFIYLVRINKGLQVYFL
jgi:transcription initiation factor TFIID subunit TAF12